MAVRVSASNSGCAGSHDLVRKSVCGCVVTVATCVPLDGILINVAEKLDIIISAHMLGV